MKKSILDLPTPALWVGLFLTMNGVVAAMSAVTWGLLWLVGLESSWTSTAALTASLLFIEFHFARRIIRELETERMLRAVEGGLKRLLDKAKAGKEAA